MGVQEKRLLLEAIQTIVIRPGTCTEQTLPIALAYFKKLINQATEGEITVIYKLKDGSDLDDVEGCQ